MDLDIFSGHKKVAQWMDNRLLVLDGMRLPLFLKHCAHGELWLSSRAIDGHRPNARKLKDVLGLGGSEDSQAALSVNAAAITDHYWARPVGQNTTCEQARAFDDGLASLALEGKMDGKIKEGFRTPELTNIGSFEKCWRLIDGEWWMCKQASPFQQFSERFVYELGRLLGFSMARYEGGEGCVWSKDFTQGRFDLELAYGFMLDNEDYEDVIGKLLELCPQAVPDYIRMIFLDAIVANPDRHTCNFGLLREAESGVLLGLAPLFDHNLALISNGYPAHPQQKDMLITLFLQVLQTHPEYEAYLSVMTKDMVKQAVGAVGMPVREQEILEYVWGRYQMVCCR